MDYLGYPPFLEPIDMAIEALSREQEKYVDGFPSAEAVQGEWEFVDNEIFAGEYFCSVCGKRAEVDLYGEWILSNYCQNCGAIMENKE